MRHFIKLLLISFLIILGLIDFTYATYASALDPTFGTEGKVITSFGYNTSLTQIASQQDGKIIAVGNASNGSDLDWAMVRYKPDGSLDTDFATSGRLMQDFGINDSIESVKVQPDGKIIVGGYTQPTGNYLWTITRYNSDGSVDSGFGMGGIVTTSFNSYLSLVKNAQLQLDGKIIAVGYRASNGQDDVALARYNPDGSLDISFGTGGIVTTPIGGSNDRGMAVALQQDGKIVVLGDYDAGGQDRIFLARYNSNGNLDSSFGSGGKVTTQIGGYDRGNAIGIQSDGKIVVSGITNFTSLDTYVARYNSNGTPDSAFGDNGKVIKSFVVGNDGVFSMLLLADGKILLGGFENTGGASGEDFALRQFNNDGTLDSSFGVSGSYVEPVGSGNDVIRSIILQNDGKIVAAGTAFNGSYNEWGLVRYETYAGLDVPYFSQNVLPWGSTEYDHSLSLGFDNPTVDRWGCLVTAAAMILNYHGMKEFPDGSEIDPGSLNVWLKNNNGYQTGKNKNGEVFSKFVWSSIPRLTNQLFQADKSTYKLVHNRPGAEQDENAILQNDLEDGKLPGILGVSNAETDMHFVVAKGKTSDSYAINDPEWNYPDLKSFDNNNFFQFDRYVRSNTNFSYIEMSINENVEILVIDPQSRKAGKQILNGTIQEFSQIPNAVYANKKSMSNDGENLGTGFNEFLLLEPLDGEYKIILSSQGQETYTLNIATVEEDGEDNNMQLFGLTSAGNPDQINLNYSQTDSSNHSHNVTFDNLIADINSLKSLGQIKKKGIYISLLTQARIAKAGKSIKSLSKGVLKSMLSELKRQRGKGLTEEAYQILKQDLEVLIILLK